MVDEDEFLPVMMRVEKLERKLETAKREVENLHSIKKVQKEESSLRDATNQSLEETNLLPEVGTSSDGNEVKFSAAELEKAGTSSVDIDASTGLSLSRNVATERVQPIKVEAHEKLINEHKREMELKENNSKMEQNLLQRQIQQQRQELFQEMIYILKDIELKENKWKLERESLEEKLDALSKKNNINIQELSAFKEYHEKERASWEIEKSHLQEERDNFQEVYKELFNKDAAISNVRAETKCKGKFSDESESKLASAELEKAETSCLDCDYSTGLPSPRNEAIERVQIIKDEVEENPKDDKVELPLHDATKDLNQLTETLKQKDKLIFEQHENYKKGKEEFLKLTKTLKQKDQLIFEQHKHLDKFQSEIWKLMDERDQLLEEKSDLTKKLEVEESPKDDKVELPLHDATKETNLLPEVGASSDGNEVNTNREVQELKTLLDEAKMAHEMEVQHYKEQLEIEQKKKSEFGTFMGSFVSIAAYIVTHANHDVKITAMSALANLGGLIIGTVFNNIVTELSTGEDATFQVHKVAKSVHWIFLGGIVPLLVGGFIHTWPKRVIVTGLVTLLLKIIGIGIWTTIYKIPKWRGVVLVFIGIVGIALAAGAPELLNLIVKRFK